MQGKWLVSIGLALICGGGRGHAEAPRIERAEVAAGGRVDIIEAARKGARTVAKAPDQVSVRGLTVSVDRLAAGWLVEVPNCCTSYPIPTMLVIYRSGLPVLRLGNGLGIWGWAFRESGKQVAYQAAPVHGDAPANFQLHEVRTGRLMDTWTGQPGDAHAPDWARDLRNTGN